ncbi:MAG: hypothetical protein ACD_9C00067G0003 [uncultured bacterium]|nr:MAG: hypothetical protein ACD_9C00067G0003 [uncultured bacterium]
MYWIYLIIFTLIVFVPTFITQEVLFFDVVQAQEFMLLFLSSLGLTLFLLQEKKLKKNLTEKCSIQSQVNRMTKDLKYSYSYIGEINRKLDILENIAINYPESSKINQKKQNELCDAIMNAIGIFAKSDQFALRFVSLPNYDILKEVKSMPESRLNFSLKGRTVDSNQFESSEFIVITSPGSIDNVFSYIVIKKRTPSQKIEDHEIMKTLAAQALFLFMFMSNNKKKNKRDVDFSSKKHYTV